MNRLKLGSIHYEQKIITNYSFATNILRSVRPKRNQFMAYRRRKKDGQGSFMYAVNN